MKEGEEGYVPKYCLFRQFEGTSFQIKTCLALFIVFSHPNSMLSFMCEKWLSKTCQPLKVKILPVLEVVSVFDEVAQTNVLIP